MKMQLHINNGRVNCPRRGDLDIDFCVGCPDLVAIEAMNGDSTLICSGSSNIRMPYESRVWGAPR